MVRVRSVTFTTASFDVRFLPGTSGVGRQAARYAGRHKSQGCANMQEIISLRASRQGSLIRQAVERQYLGPMREQKRAALESLLSQEVDVGS